MVKKRAPAKAAHNRFTVTLDGPAYRRLKALAKKHDPPLSLNYVVKYAVKLLLQRADDSQFMFDFADPTRRKRET